MKFTPGKSGNPRGRKRGVRNKATPLREQLERAGPAVIERVIAAAVGGDLQACRMVLDRIVPVVRPIEIATPPPPAASKESVTRKIHEIFGIVPRPSMPTPARPAEATPAQGPNPDGTAPAPTAISAPAPTEEPAGTFDAEAAAAMS